MIEFMRLDDRFIHGQVATTWIRHVAPEALVLVDDEIAADKMRQSLMKMSAPKDIPLAIYDTRRAVEKLTGSLAHIRIFVLVGNTRVAREICLACGPVELNLGNMGFKEGYENLINRIWVSEDDKKNISTIQQSGVRVYAQMLPDNMREEIPPL